MIFEYKNFDGNNNQIIEIVSSDSALGLLKRSGNNNIKVCLPLSLSIGKIEKDNPFNRNVLSLYHMNNKSYDYTKELNNLTNILNNNSKIRIWSSHLDCDDYCLLLLICYLFKDRHISVIFSEELNWNVTTISAISKKELFELEKREHILTDEQKQNYSDMFKKIINDNKELRYMINGTVISCNIDTFDKEIINRAKIIDKSRLVTNLMNDPIIPNVIFPEWLYTYLIYKLENNKKI